MVAANPSVIFLFLYLHHVLAASVPKSEVIERFNYALRSKHLLCGAARPITVVNGNKISTQQRASFSCKLSRVGIYGISWLPTRQTEKEKNKSFKCLIYIYIFFSIFTYGNRQSFT